MGVLSDDGGDLAAYPKWLIRHKAKQLTGKAGFSISDKEDLEQELAAHLLAQAHHFDPQRGSPNTFAARVINSNVAMLLRDRRRLKRGAGIPAASLERTVVSGDGETTSMAEQISSADLVRRMGLGHPNEDTEKAAAVVQAFQSLSRDLQEVCLRLMDTPPAAVARDMNISRRELGNAIAQIRERFEKAGLGES
jgi:RNA polymerase sigma-70 factor (ECF subfamily)